MKFPYANLNLSSKKQKIFRFAWCLNFIVSLDQKEYRVFLIVLTRLFTAISSGFKLSLCCLLLICADASFHYSSLYGRLALISQAYAESNPPTEFFKSITSNASDSARETAKSSPNAEHGVITIETAVARALAGNPGLAEIKARAEALAAVPSQVGALPDPTINLGMLNMPTRNFNLQQEDMTMMEMGISQTIPFPGKRSLREQIAEHEAMATEEALQDARLRLAAEVKQSWWRLFYYAKTLALLDTSAGFFQQLIDIAQSNYKVAKGSQQDVMLTQLELSKLKAEKLDLLTLRGAEYAKLNTLINRIIEFSVHLPSEAVFKFPDLSATELQNKALKFRPLFAQHGKMLEVAKANVELAKKDFYPDFTVGGGYAFRQNTPTGQTRSDFASVQLSMNVPLYAAQKQSKAVDQRNSELLQEQYAAEDEHHKILSEIVAKVAEYKQLKEKTLLLEQEVIPQAQQTLNALMAGYQVSQSGFSDLLRTELSVLQYQMQYWQTKTNTQAVLAELSADVGEDLYND